MLECKELKREVQVGNWTIQSYIKPLTSFIKTKLTPIFNNGDKTGITTYRLISVLSFSPTSLGKLGITV